MKYRINFTKRADSHVKIILKSGNKADISTGIGNPEQLKYELSGFWSRRLNQKDRLIYQILEEEVIVIVVSALGHYK